MSKLLKAYTEPTGVYPAYINVSEQEGVVNVTVRGPAKKSTDIKNIYSAGDVVVLSMSRTEFALFCADTLTAMARN
jgi:hypothetical protein